MLEALHHIQLLQELYFISAERQRRICMNFKPEWLYILFVYCESIQALYMQVWVCVLLTKRNQFTASVLASLEHVTHSWPTTALPMKMFSLDNWLPQLLPGTLLWGPELFIKCGFIHSHTNLASVFSPATASRVWDIKILLWLSALQDLCVGVSVDVGILLTKFWFAFWILLKLSPVFCSSDVDNESSVFHGCTSELKVDPARAMKERNPEVFFSFSPKSEEC